MPYKVERHSHFERDLKAFKKNKPAKKQILEQVMAVLENPNKGEPYTENLFGLYKVTFGESPQYRLIYRKYECCKKSENQNECPVLDAEVKNEECDGAVSFIFIRTREACNNLYKKERGYFEDTIREGLTPM